MTETFLCPRCGKTHETLEARYAGDEALLALYQKKLPRKGWAGMLDCTEREYIMRVSPSRRAAADRGRAKGFPGQRGQKTGGAV